MEKKKAWRWTPHWHVAQGRGHRVVGFNTEGEMVKAIVGITFRGAENIHVIPVIGTIYNNVDVRRRVSPSLMK
jgi:hypothetical protein